MLFRSKWAGDFKVQDIDNIYFKKVICIQTTSGYLITKKFASVLKNKLQECVGPLERTHNKDLYALDIYWKQLQPISNWFITNPILGIQEPGFSDIENKIVDYGC